MCLQGTYKLTANTIDNGPESPNWRLTTDIKSMNNCIRGQTFAAKWYSPVFAAPPRILGTRAVTDFEHRLFLITFNAIKLNLTFNFFKNQDVLLTWGTFAKYYQLCFVSISRPNFFIKLNQLNTTLANLQHT